MAIDQFDNFDITPNRPFSSRMSKALHHGTLCSNAWIMITFALYTRTSHDKFLGDLWGISMRGCVLHFWKLYSLLMKCHLFAFMFPFENPPRTGEFRE